MTRSHARNNTTQSTLTYYERSLLRKGNEAQRIGQDSFKPLDSCYLCLSKVTSPFACPQGHIYCQECILSNLITQKASIEAQRREMERWEAREEQERFEAKQRARERVISDFEKGMGLGGAGGRKLFEDRGDKDTVGRLFELNGDVVEKVAKEAEEKALRTIEAEQAEGRKAKLAAFWLPSLAPEAKLGPLKDVKLQTLCHMGGHPHPVSRKTLLPVIFTYPTPTSKPTCPSCTKELSNSTSSVLLSSRSPAVAPDAPKGDRDDEQPKKKKSKKDKEDPFVCGHVVCKTCTDTIVKPSGRCCVCEAKVDEGGQIPLGKEGTGFAAAGGAEAKNSRAITFRV
ncbi:hypothetical protein BCR39DRAFT_526397 [Naematelia encephala]|uniref:RING-type domain-containing protein n=1 Tax=Naematelia encephala TaxID=71784 RepID=A0A1Y2BA48_9TREE|nr:hypothetical protein BCR39DRAFT_526397 [Naematelia encephala]